MIGEPRGEYVLIMVWYPLVFQGCEYGPCALPMCAIVSIQIRELMVLSFVCQLPIEMFHRVQGVWPGIRRHLRMLAFSDVDIAPKTTASSE